MLGEGAVLGVNVAVGVGETADTTVVVANIAVDWAVMVGVGVLAVEWVAVAVITGVPVPTGVPTGTGAVGVPAGVPGQTPALR